MNDIDAAAPRGDRPIDSADDAMPDLDTSISIDASTANAALDQLRSDREAVADQLVAPPWYYSLNGVLLATSYLLVTWFAGYFHYQADRTGWSLNARYSIVELPFIVIGIGVLEYVLTLRIWWRGQQLGSDFGTFWGWLAPRNTVMRVWLVTSLLIILLSLLSVVVWVWHFRSLTDVPLIVGMALCAFGWFDAYAYDRYYVALVKRGQ
jgi:hypothetical protein